MHVCGLRLAPCLISLVYSCFGCVCCLVPFGLLVSVVWVVYGLSYGGWF